MLVSDGFDGVFAMRITRIVTTCSLVGLCWIAQSASAGIVIHEVDYQQQGGDVAEFVELHNPDSVPVALTGLDLVLRDGSAAGSCAEYCRVPLDSFALPANGFLVFGQTACAVAPLCLPVGGIENSMDAVSVEERATGLVVDSLVYEAFGTSSCPYNTTTVSDSATSTGSIQLQDSGWEFGFNPTPCAPNIGGAIASARSSWSVIKASFLE